MDSNKILLSEMVIIDDHTLPIPKYAVDNNIITSYLEKCESYIQCHDPKDFKVYWGISPVDYPKLYDDSIYTIARLCYLLIDCDQVVSWSQCWKHKTGTDNFIVNVDGKARCFYNKLFSQLKAEIPDKKVEFCELCSNLN